MPCTDINEIIIANLDNQYCFIDYELLKSGCNASVGDSSLLVDWVKGKTLEQILAGLPADLFVLYQAKTDEQKFMVLKHYQALVALAAQLTGLINEDDNQTCIINSLDATQEGIKLTAMINLTIDAGKVSPCGNTCQNSCNPQDLINVALFSQKG